jgi:hypothetical protein
MLIWMARIRVMISACVGFLYIENFNFLSFSYIVSSKMIALCSSVSIVNFIHVVICSIL